MSCWPKLSNQPAWPQVGDRPIGVSQVSRNAAAQDIDLGVLVVEMLADQQRQIASGAEVSVGDLRVIGHWGQLLRLLHNLVSNALKFRDPAVPVGSRFGANVTTGVTLAVKDNGLGI